MNDIFKGVLNISNPKKPNSLIKIKLKDYLDWNDLNKHMIKKCDKDWYVLTAENIPYICLHHIFEHDIDPEIFELRSKMHLFKQAYIDAIYEFGRWYMFTSDFWRKPLINRVLTIVDNYVCNIHSMVSNTYTSYSVSRMAVAEDILKSIDHEELKKHFKDDGLILAGDYVFKDSEMFTLLDTNI